MNTNAPELVALRRESPDWKETHGVWFGLKAGQMFLDETVRLQQMTPENRDRLLSLLHRWVDLTNDAENLHREVESDLRRSLPVTT